MVLKKCKECGNEVSTKAESCPKCGAVLKKKMGCLGYIGAVFLILIILGIIGSLMNEGTKKSPSSKSEIFRLGEGIRIGELLITFTSLTSAKTFDTGRYPTLPLSQDTIKISARPNYKLIVLNVTGKNIGLKKDGLWLQGTERQDYELEVDKGYIYSPLMLKGIININLLPEESGADELVFEILENTTPLKLHAFVKESKFNVDLKSGSK